MEWGKLRTGSSRIQSQAILPYDYETEQPQSLAAALLRLNRSHKTYTMFTRGQPTFVFDHIVIHSKYVLSWDVSSLTFYLVPSNLPKESAKMQSWVVQYVASPIGRGTPLTRYAYYLVSSYSSRPTDHIVRWRTWLRSYRPRQHHRVIPMTYPHDLSCPGRPTGCSFDLPSDVSTSAVCFYFTLPC